jgi:tetratricopeptide (TPR) repeat protein
MPIPRTLDNMMQRARAALEAGDVALAEHLSRTALELAPDNVMALSWLGIALSSQGRYSDAEAAFGRAAALDPDNPAMHLNLGNALLEARAFDRAVTSFERALVLEPDHPEALNSLGCALAGRGQHAAAIARFEQALERRPGYGEAYDNLGESLLQSGRESEAAAAFGQAVACQPTNPDFHGDLGNALAAGHRWAEAIASYERALTLDPDFADARYNLAVARLFRHEFEAGWPCYEARLRSPSFVAGMRKDPATLVRYAQKPKWRGPGHQASGTVAIWAEQGIGDQLLFSTLLPELAATGVSLVYEVDDRLLDAYRRSFPEVHFVPSSDPPGHELQRAGCVSLAGSLPHFFRRSRRDFARQPHRLLRALSARVADYRQQLEALGPGPRVGVSWRSTRTDYWGPSKNMPLADMTSLLRKCGVQFVDLQYGDTEEQRRASEAAGGARLVHFESVDYYRDLEELLAIIEACDLVITTSNVTAHLAGALGKQTWLLFLSDRPPFHYWQPDSATRRSLWYPSVEIVSGPELSHWPSLINHVARRLEGWHAGFSPDGG